MIAYFDIFSGISGDMVLGAFIDLGVPVEWLKQQLGAICPPSVDIRAERIRKSHLSSISVFVEEGKDTGHRDYKAIKEIISASPFSSSVKERSLRAFEKIARAEARIHSRDMDTVHFHEVGGIDAIVDITGAFLCAEYLGIDEVHASHVTMGSGFVECSHGTLPVPVPATLEILQDVPVTTRAGTGELVTPTGAAVLTTLADSFGEMPDMILNKTGYGAGKRETGSPVPNLLRIITGRRSKHRDREESALTRESVYVIETTIDDMNPEFLGYLMEKLFDAGALDVCHIPVQMKKSRPGTRLEILCHPENLDELIHLVFLESTTTGIRYFNTLRARLDRETIRVNSGFGEILAKKITLPDGSVRLQPEYEVCRRIAEEENLPLITVYSQLELDMKTAGL